MFETIDPRSPTPHYAQIATRIRVAVAAGEVGPGEALPSVRSLAQRLRVNPATVVQAYRELEMDGFVERRHGAGTFVCDVPTDRKTEERTAQAQTLARHALQEAGRLGIAAAELLAALRDEMGEGTQIEEPAAATPFVPKRSTGQTAD